MESPDSFCDGLGVIYIASSRGRNFFDLTTKDMGFGVKVWSWEGVRHPKPSNPKVDFLSLCLVS